MKTFSEYNPLALTAYFLAVSAIPMFCGNPLITAVSLIGALLLFSLQGGSGRTLLYFLLLFLTLALLNPLVSHNGVTVLFVMNHNPVTLEALLYGISAAGGMIAVLCWFSGFSRIMTRDRLLYVFGKLTPKLALVLSMAIRYVSLFAQQTRKTVQAQKALGLYREDTLSIRGSVRVFSIMLTWALENGIITADSMAARGYGTGKRTHFAQFRFRLSDTVFLILSILFFGITCAGIGAGSLDFVFYPAITYAEISPLAVCSTVSYGALVLLPAVIEMKEVLKWRSYRSSM